MQLQRWQKEPEKEPQNAVFDACVYRRAPTAFHPDVYIRLSKTVGAGDNDIESIILATYEEQCYSLCDLKPCRICASC
jgi:hypothetical protein